MRPQTENQLKREGVRARRLFSHAHMSDTKCRKMFDAMKAASVEIRQLIVKFIDVDEAKVINFKSMHLFDAHPVADTIEFGPIEFRAIEWIEVPAIARTTRANNLPPQEIPQDLDALQTIINSLGRYPIERSAKGLLVRGYSN